MILFYVAKQTFQEIYESKVLMNVAFLGAFLFLVTYIVSEFSYGVANKVTLDIGLGTLSLSATGIALFLGATLIQKEISSRTLYMIISRPVTRTSFLLGKLFGLAGILFVNVSILFLILYLFYSLLGGGYNSLIPWALFYIYLESLMVMLIVVFFSLVSNNMISVFVTLTLYGAGHGIDTVKETGVYEKSELLRWFVDNYSYFAPNFGKLNIKSYVLYEKFLDFSFLYSALFYGIFWIIIFTAFAGIIISRKEFS